MRKGVPFSTPSPPLTFTSHTTLFISHSTTNSLVVTTAPTCVTATAA
jgi:hypothetical protein